MTGARRKILVVDDEEEVRGLIEKLLLAAGQVAVAAGDPAWAVELARREARPRPLRHRDARSGRHGVLKALQSDPDTARVPVVFLTAHREFSERVRAFRFGVVD